MTRPKRAKLKRSGPLTKQKNFRLSTMEAKHVLRAARQAGLTESEWLRQVVRTALGDRTLLEQLWRVAPARPRADDAEP